MRSANRMLPQLVLIVSIFLLAAWVGISVLGGRPIEPQRTADAVLQNNPPAVPEAVGTLEPTILPEWSPSAVPPTSTPTAATLQPAVLVTPASITQTTLDPSLLQPGISTADSAEAITNWAWAPTGDKLVYLTASGRLYWSNLDGSDATLIHTYSPSFNLLDEQRPLTNTLFISHKGNSPSEDHLDLLHFSLGQPPTLQQASQPGVLFDLNWWAPDRISGTRADTYFGGERLYTLDSNGQLVEQQDVPYMLYGVVRPAGGLLAYVSSSAVKSTPVPGFEPATAYVLNLSTGSRIQITEAGKASHVHNWSPDGAWVLLDATINGQCGAALVSSDGIDVVIIPEGCGQYLYDAVWSPDSQHLAFSLQSGGCDAESQGNCPPYSSQIYIVDIPAKKVVTTPDKQVSETSSGQMMKPKWSPDGSILGFLSFDPQCTSDMGTCSETTPAFYFVPVGGRGSKQANR